MFNTPYGHQVSVQRLKRTPGECSTAETAPASPKTPKNTQPVSPSVREHTAHTHILEIDPQGVKPVLVDSALFVSDFSMNTVIRGMNGATEVHRALPHIVISTRNTAKNCTAGRLRGELTPVFRNVLVHTSYLAEASDKWDAARRVNAARICAVGALLPQGWILLGQGAAFTHGIDTFAGLFDIEVGKGARTRRRTETLPEITIPLDSSAAGVVPAAQLVLRQAGVDDEHLSTRETGLRVPDLATTAAMCACDLPPKEASVAVSGILRVMSSFSRFHEKIAASRRREEDARTEVMRRLSQMPRTRGCRKARAVIATADAACESVPERVLVWILRAAGFPEVRTQVHHRVNGRDYYVDVEVPPWDIAVESDSRGKHETNGEIAAQIHQSYERQAARQRDLESIGLSFVRFSPSDYEDPDAVALDVARRCRTTPRRPVKLLLP